jgi:uncharacterized protein (DUF1697 family)
VLTWVALLRGINVGGHRKVSMPVLREALTEAGFADVRTYVNSGNVVLRSAQPDPAEVSSAVRRVIAERFDLDVPVVVRTGPQLAEILTWNPFPDAVADRPHLVHVIHLTATPEPERVRDLLAADVTPDQLAARATEVVVAYAGSSQRSPAEAEFRRLGVEGTARNWRTLTALVDLAGGG